MIFLVVKVSLQILHQRLLQGCASQQFYFFFRMKLDSAELSGCFYGAFFPIVYFYSLKYVHSLAAGPCPQPLCSSATLLLMAKGQFSGESYGKWEHWECPKG